MAPSPRISQTKEPTSDFLPSLLGYDLELLYVRVRGHYGQFSIVDAASDLGRFTILILDCFTTITTVKYVDFFVFTIGFANHHLIHWYPKYSCASRVG